MTEMANDQVVHVASCPASYYYFNRCHVFSWLMMFWGPAIRRS